MSAKGSKGALIAIVAGTKSTTVTGVLKKITVTKREKVKEITLGMSNAMESIVRQSFPKFSTKLY